MSKGKILLIYPSYSYPRKSPPLGLAYLAAYLEKFGYEPLIVDMNTSLMSDVQLATLVRGSRWLYVGISFMTNQFSEAARLAELIKSATPSIQIVAGGPHASSIPERTLTEIPQLDVVVRGEGEETARDISECLSNNCSLETIPGISLRCHGKIVHNIDRELIANLDDLPFAAWKHLDVEKYNIFKIGVGKDAPAFPILTSRGCPNHCIFCDSHTIFHRVFRARSARNIFQEIMYLHENYGTTEFDFVDDLITVLRPRILELCDLMLGSGIPFRWMANARVNTVDHELLKAMKNAGCVRVDFGVETGDPEVRRVMKKNITEKQIRDAHRISQELGLSTGTFTMVGNLGETFNSIRMTEQLLAEVGEDVVISIACPYPGTELYHIAKEKKLINTEDWSRYVTSPTYITDYRPVMRTDDMSEDQILKSFYYLHSKFAARKFKIRFGRYFYLNYHFYSEWVLRGGLLRRVRMALRLISARVKGSNMAKGSV